MRDRIDARTVLIATPLMAVFRQSYQSITTPCIIMNDGYFDELAASDGLHQYQPRFAWMSWLAFVYYR